jgi:polo-like kinase 1
VQTQQQQANSNGVEETKVGGYTQRFDIYQDNKQSTLNNSGKSLGQQPSLSRTGSGMTSHDAQSVRGVSPRGNNFTNFDTDETDAMDVDQIGVKLDGVHISGAKRAAPQVAWGAETVDSAPRPAPEKSEGTHTPAPHASKAATPKPLDTLEGMHKMLNRSFAETGDGPGSPAALLAEEAEVSTPVAEDKWAHPTPAAVSKLIARVWVVRYVDYTSKYGLGFLLNTGSAGVYFNDSTKIVLSTDGSVFQYIERHRKEGQANSEHVSQTHLMSAYPMELQKKVTLLRHFRNYLVDQQKMYGHGSRTGESTLESVSSLPMSLPDGASSGADPSITFGSSSAHFSPVDAVEMGLSSPMNMQQMQQQSQESDMPFLKKWVRTRHAILFRLSNRIVQVVFFDRSEVLLSSEARVVTYVNKQGEREDHSLEDVLHAGRTDIAKRLKYTKDIMYRLISVAK